MGSYIPSTREERLDMLHSIGMHSFDELYADIPESLRLKDGLSLPVGLSEMEVARKMEEISEKNTRFSHIFRGAGITRYSPLAEWRHEDILAYIHYYDVKLPPIYDWEKGYLCGTHPWPARQYMETEQQGWKEVYDIDKTIVENAAQHFDGAREFLKAIK